VRVLLDSTVKMMDGKKPVDMKLTFPLKFVKNKALKKVSGTVIEDLLKRYNVI
jgi:oleate hydratase